MNRPLTLLFALLCAAILLVVLLMRGVGVASPTNAGLNDAPELPAREAESRAAPSAPPPHSRPASAPVGADRLPAHQPAPRRGVRGSITSPRVVLGDGTNGVDPASWEGRVFALVPSPERHTVDRIGILCERAPQSPRGDFAIDLPTGPHLILIQHRVSRPPSAPLLEAWYAYAEIRETDSGLTDLGRHSFAAASIEGTVFTERGDPCEGVTVAFSDETKDPLDPLPRGVFLMTGTDAAGRFAFSVARGDLSLVVGHLSARRDGAEARREGVRPGDLADLVLLPPELQAAVVLEIPWSPETRFWILAQERKLGFMRDGGKAPAHGLIEERRLLPIGRYVVEVFRRSEPGCDEWARASFEVTDARPRRIRIDPVFQRARTITGHSRSGARIAWVARSTDGSTLVRESALVDSEGRFILRGLPTTELFLSAGSILIPVPPGCEPELDLGELQSG